MRSLPLILLLSTLAACGTRGPLVLPPGPPPKPWLDKTPAPATQQTPQVPSDNNNKPAPQ